MLHQQYASVSPQHDPLLIKSDRDLAHQLKISGVVFQEYCEKAANTKQVLNFTALSIDSLREYGLYLGISVNDQEYQMTTQNVECL
ncbi:hypothetical protein [Photobacterium kasasachensis]|uniref:hypothetical protein n=1 Tax=Photobacterium kasasachensis TaxID=2910240 RepID=UPI003D10D1DA